MQRLNELYGRLLDALATIGALMIFFMMALICTDVGLRAFGGRGIGWSGEVSEYIMYLSTFVAAPWLLRMGKHVRLDVLLRALPPKFGWGMEWFTDLVGLAVSITLAVAGGSALLASKSSSNLIIKTLQFPEWYMLIPVPVTFGLLAVEFVFRMYRLSDSPIGVRDDATSAA